jgi:hypothetical protein
MSLKDRTGLHYTVRLLGDEFLIETSPSNSYSKWHRTGPKRIAFLDIDYIEYCERCYEPLLLCELAHGTKNTNKPYYVTRNLALKAGIPAVVILYETDDDGPTGTLNKLRVRQVAPDVDEFKAFLPSEWAAILVHLHDRHTCAVRRSA